MDDYQIDNDSGVPVWVQVRRRLVYCIASGRYQPGDQLPTVRELAVQLDINYNTVNKVYQYLERESLIITKRGRGTFVADTAKGKLLPLDSKVDWLADEFVHAGLDCGMTEANLKDLVAQKVFEYGSRGTATAPQNSQNLHSSGASQAANTPSAGPTHKEDRNAG